MLVKHTAIPAPKAVMAHIKRVMEAITAKFLTKDADHQNIFEGPTFPQEIEVKQFLHMCKVVQEHYVCISPLDQNKASFKDKEVKCTQSEVTNGKPCAIEMIRQRF